MQQPVTFHFSLRLGLYLAGVLLASLPHSSTAELYKCNGTWTNKPCGTAAVSIPERPVRAPDTKSLDSSEMKSLQHSVTTQAFEAKRKYKLSFELGEVNAKCKPSTGNLDECRKAVSTLQDTISKRSFEAQSLKIQEANNKLLEERNKIEAERGTHVTIIRNVDIVLTPLPTLVPVDGISGSISIQGKSNSIKIEGAIPAQKRPRTAILSQPRTISQPRDQKK